MVQYVVDQYDGILFVANVKWVWDDLCVWIIFANGVDDGWVGFEGACWKVTLVSVLEEEDYSRTYHRHKQLRVLKDGLGPRYTAGSTTIAGHTCKLVHNSTPYRLIYASHNAYEAVLYSS